MAKPSSKPAQRRGKTQSGFSNIRAHFSNISAAHSAFYLQRIGRITYNVEQSSIYILCYILCYFSLFLRFIFLYLLYVSDLVLHTQTESCCRRCKEPDRERRGSSGCRSSYRRSGRGERGADGCEAKQRKEKSHFLYLKSFCAPCCCRYLDRQEEDITSGHIYKVVNT